VELREALRLLATRIAWLGLKPEMAIVARPPANSLGKHCAEKHLHRYTRAG
jgi:hypothetical protein